MNKKNIKFAVFVALIVAVVIFAKFSGIGEFLSPQKIRTLLDEMGLWAPLAFIALYAVTAMVGLPGTIFTVIGGLLFGKWFGTLYNIIGATLGASGAFWISRMLARDAFYQKFAKQKWFIKFNEGLEKEGLYYMLFVRLVPIFPYNGLNFGAGLTKISFRNYFIGTAIGMIPASFVYTNAAAEIGESAAEGFKLTPGIITAFVLLGIVALVPILIKKRMEKKRESKKKTEIPTS